MGGARRRFHAQNACMGTSSRASGVAVSYFFFPSSPLVWLSS